MWLSQLRHIPLFPCIILGSSRASLNFSPHTSDKPQNIDARCARIKPYESKENCLPPWISELNESARDWNMMLQRSAIKRQIFFFLMSQEHHHHHHHHWRQLICLSVAAGMPVRCLRESKVTCWLFFYLIEIAWDQGNEPLWCSRKGRIYQ